MLSTGFGDVALSADLDDPDTDTNEAMDWDAGGSAAVTLTENTSLCHRQRPTCGGCWCASGGAKMAVPMFVHPPWTLDVETIVGVAITLLVILVPYVVARVASWRRSRRRDRDVLPRLWRSSGPGEPAPREPDTA